MQIPAIFFDHKKRNLILWLTDMSVAIASYFYMTNPLNIEKVLHGLDFAAIRPDVDPEVFTSPVFFEFMHTVISVTALITIAVIVVFHALAFYKCFKRKRAAIAYVKMYCVLAAASLVMWFVTNISATGSLILIPATIYTLVFLAEKNSQSPQSIIDNILKADQP